MRGSTGDSNMGGISTLNVRDLLHQKGAVRGRTHKYSEWKLPFSQEHFLSPFLGISCEESSLNGEPFCVHVLRTKLRTE